MDAGQTTAAIQDYLDELDGAAGATAAGSVVTALLGRAVHRLRDLCATTLNRGYPRLARPPLGLDTDELLGSVVERLLKALRQTRPRTVRGFFALANQHIPWELNELARGLAARTPSVDVREDAIVDPVSSGAELGPDARRILDAIDALPDDEREAFGLVRIQGLSHAEAAAVLGVATKTVQRRLNRAVLLLTEQLNEYRPGPAGEAGRDP
jgi:RNA polymerase sigma-70 factor (ECF subfamily)